MIKAIANKQTSLAHKWRNYSENSKNNEQEKEKSKPMGLNSPWVLAKPWDNASPAQLEDDFQQYKRTIQRYNHNIWTKAEQINKEFIPDLKNWKVDAHQLVSTIHKITETTRLQARASTELYKQLQYLQDKAEFTTGKDREIFNNTIEQAQRLAIFGFGSAKLQEKEAKEISLKALKLPASIKHLEYSTEEDGKTNTFDRDFIEQLQKARFEAKVIRDTTSFGRGNSSNNHEFNGSRGRGGSRGHSFQHGGRGRGIHSSNQQNWQSSQQYQTPEAVSNKNQ